MTAQRPDAGADPKPEEEAAPNLAPDPIAKRLGKCLPTDVSEGYVSFKGYLGPALEDGTYPLYLDEEFRSWIRLRAEDIKERFNLANAQDPHSVIFVERRAKLTRCQTGFANEIADEVWGADPAGGGIRPRRPY